MDIILNEFLRWLNANDKEFKEKSNYDSNVKFTEILKEYELQNKKIEEEDEKENITNTENILKGRIDLFSSKDDVYLVIENKIKSKINGRKENGYQLKFYKSAIKEKYKNSKFMGIILVPNYNKDLIENEAGYRDVQNDYTIVTYQKLSAFFKSIKEDKLDDENARRYFEDFKNALYIHTLSAEEKEKNKFKKAILDTKETKYTLFVARFKEKEDEGKETGKEEIRYKYYIGITNNLDKRKRELSITDKFKGYDKDKFIWFKEYSNLNLAIDDEEGLEEKIVENIEIRKKENRENYDYLEEKDIKNLLKELK